jgi:ADP-ribose pyrophosphatase YjhB (NUDIX family)
VEVEQQPCGMHTLVADVALMTAGKVLLTKYRDVNKYDHQHGWFLPDDALNHFEHPETAAKRILKEQLNVTVPKLSLGFIESFKGNRGTWHLAFHYKAELQEPPSLEPSEDVESAEWFPLSNLPDRNDVAHHGWALSVLREMMRRT